jgi:hypothetical protein
VRSTPALWFERADQQLYRAKAWAATSSPGAHRGVGGQREEKRLLFETFQDHE